MQSDAVLFYDASVAMDTIYVHAGDNTCTMVVSGLGSSQWIRTEAPTELVAQLEVILDALEWARSHGLCVTVKTSHRPAYDAIYHPKGNQAPRVLRRFIHRWMNDTGSTVAYVEPGANPATGQCSRLPADDDLEEEGSPAFCYCIDPVSGLVVLGEMPLAEAPAAIRTGRRQPRRRNIGRNGRRW